MKKCKKMNKYFQDFEGIDIYNEIEKEYVCYYEKQIFPFISGIMEDPRLQENKISYFYFNSSKTESIIYFHKISKKLLYADRPLLILLYR